MIGTERATSAFVGELIATSVLGAVIGLAVNETLLELEGTYNAFLVSSLGAIGSVLAYLHFPTGERLHGIAIRTGMRKRNQK